MWMGRMASTASVHLAPCLHSAYLRTIPVPTSPVVMESAMTHQAGKALSQLPLLLSPPTCHTSLPPPPGSAVCVSPVGVALDAARAWLQMPVSPSPARLVAPAPVMEKASAAPVPLDSRVCVPIFLPRASTLLFLMFLFCFLFLKLCLAPFVLRVSVTSYVCMWRPEPDACHPSSLSTYSSEAGSLPEPGVCAVLGRSEASESLGSSCFLPTCSWSCSLLCRWEGLSSGPHDWA